MITSAYVCILTENWMSMHESATLRFYTEMCVCG